MTKEEYLKEIEAELSKVLADSKFNNNRSQLSAWKLSADFNRTYDEGYLWNRALFLSSSACHLLLNTHNHRLPLNCLKESALIYENLASISEHYDKDYCLVLSALCYDLGGYQANAVCLLKKLDGYSFTSSNQLDDLTFDNYVLEHVLYILLKRIPMGRSRINRKLDRDPGTFLFNNAIESWYTQILEGTGGEFMSLISACYAYYLETRNIPVSQLIFMLKVRMEVYKERSILMLRANGQIGGNPIWEKYFRLLAGDIYDGFTIKAIEKRFSKFEFWTSQLRAVQKGLLDRTESFVVQMPTSAGKTFVAELAILNALVSSPGRKCLYISPFRALTNEKEGELSENLSKLGYSVSALSGNYEVDDYQDILIADSDVLIATPEKMDLLLRQNPAFFENIALAVIDEGHVLGEISSRSSLLEFLLIRLKMLLRELQILFISAVMPPENANEYSMWLSNTNDNVLRSLLHPDSTMHEEWEPTRKLIGSFTWEGNNGTIVYLNMQTEDEVTKVVTRSFIPSIIKKLQYAGTIPSGGNKAETSASLAFRFAQDGNTLVYCAQVADTQRVGSAFIALINALKASGEQLPEWATQNRERESYFFARKWYGENSYIPLCLERGIGIHFGDLPESVRRSVESDFAGGRLKVLIATNTVAQGLNFPIKNLVIHSTIMNGDPDNKVLLESRDFWNIVGRAGRAGMETEGQVIFNINTANDRRQYRFYINKANLNPANSILYNVLLALLEARISQATFENNIRILVEPYLLSILAEEAMGTEDEEIIQRILDQSLFNVQSTANHIDIEPVKNSFRGIFLRIQETLSPEQIRAYGLTGLCVNSNVAIEAFIEQRLDEILLHLAADDFEGFLSLIYQMMDTGGVDELESQKIDKIKAVGNFSSFLNITLSWISGNDVDVLLQQWAPLSNNPVIFNLLISEGFYFRFPWIISSFTEILLFKLNAERDQLPTNIASLVSYIKYGLNNPRSCLLKSIGIKNRDVAQLLDGYSGGLEGRELLRFISNLSMDDLGNLDISRFDKENIIGVSLKLTPQRYPVLPEVIGFWVKGIGYSQEQVDLSLVISEDDPLELRRAYDNPFDPFAIEVLFNGEKLGYMPREFAKMVSVEIDVNGAVYDGIVADVLEIGNHQDIFVNISLRS
ncbi:DEAD/DEAH box helicase [Pedobacter agri]|uniref:DEAD/DEAH box helicase n=1 Tax=Pedobacter agri TaxID=454586 RepID=UPI00292E63DB|nr:DEAD/DEAH box helicase [Pedobacter agri]